MRKAKCNGGAYTLHTVNEDRTSQSKHDQMYGDHNINVDWPLQMKHLVTTHSSTIYEDRVNTLPTFNEDRASERIH